MTKRGNINVYDLNSADELKKHIWKTQKIFFPFAIPWQRFVAILLWESISATYFGLCMALSAFIVQWLFPIIGALNVLNLGAIAGCIAMAHWSIFLLTVKTQERMHIEYILSSLKKMGMGKDEFSKFIDNHKE